MEEENKKEEQSQETETQEKSQPQKSQAQESSKEEATQKASSEKEKQNTGMAVLAYVLFLIPLLSGYKEDKFVMYHIKQGAVLFFTGLVLSMIPFIGWLLNLGVFILFIIGVSNALNGKKKELPLIGGFAKKLNF